jgi:hypothetical protein
MNLEGKTVLVSGSTDGVGRLVARRLADQGAREHALPWVSLVIGSFSSRRSLRFTIGLRVVGQGRRSQNQPLLFPSDRLPLSRFVRTTTKKINGLEQVRVLSTAPPKN